MLSFNNVRNGDICIVVYTCHKYLVKVQVQNRIPGILKTTNTIY